MFDPQPFLPGRFEERSLPLVRFLPEVPAGSAVQWLETRARPGSWVLDPFGASPSLAFEIARSGYRLLLAANNPTIRFVLETQAKNLPINVFQASLAHLAAAKIHDDRVEPHLLSLYETPCLSCGTLVSADAFLWAREAEAPFARVYHCRNCGQHGEFPTVDYDHQKAKQAAATRLHYARILERVASVKDPDRKHAEEALRHYPPRAVYALGVLVNKLDIFPQEEQSHLSALMMHVFDQTNTLWPYPVGRPRPKQLTIPPKYYEKNAFFALEQAVDIWTRSSEPAASVTHYPEIPPETGGICIFDGKIRDLASQLETMEIDAVVSAIPRPNQAFWTLSSLWAGWLGGREAVEPFKGVLRRQRYDWRWHTTALHAALTHLVPRLKPETPFFMWISENEPGLLAAGLLSAEHAGLETTSLAMPAPDNLAQIQWHIKTRASMQVNLKSEREIIVEAIKHYLKQLGEPGSFLSVLAAAVIARAETRESAFYDDTQPAEDYTETVGKLEEILTYQNGFLRFNGGKELHIGQWWLRDQPNTIPTADQVERKIYNLLTKQTPRPFSEIAESIYIEFPGLLSPDLNLVAACVESYAEINHLDEYALRPEDDPVRRKNEENAIRNTLIVFGERLGFNVARSNIVHWQHPSSSYNFHITTSAALSEYLKNPEYLSRDKNWIVLPGGRANLLLYKRQADAHLDYRLRDWQFLKFRHLRSLAQNPLISINNLDEHLSSDQLTYEISQLKLL